MTKKQIQAFVNISEHGDNKSYGELEISNGYQIVTPYSGILYHESVDAVRKNEAEYKPEILMDLFHKIYVSDEILPVYYSDDGEFSVTGFEEYVKDHKYRTPTNGLGYSIHHNRIRLKAKDESNYNTPISCLYNSKFVLDLFHAVGKDARLYVAKIPKWKYRVLYIKPEHNEWDLTKDIHAFLLPVIDQYQ